MTNDVTLTINFNDNEDADDPVTSVEIYVNEVGNLCLSDDNPDNYWMLSFRPLEWAAIVAFAKSQGF